MNNRFAQLDLEALYGIPLMCPVAKCQSQMSPLEMLTHLLMRHNPQDSMTEIGADVEKQYEVELDKLTPGRNHSVGVIAYGGNPKPGLSCAVTPDLQIVHNLPIIIMLYVSPPVLNMEQVYIFYLVSPVASRLVSAHLTLLDGCHANETFGLRCLRNSLDSPLKDSQDLLYCNMDYLLYTATDIRGLCPLGMQGKIFVKIVLHGDPDIFEVHTQQKVSD
ncbi:uncharacterized protein LOC108110720 [Drosophila eugracilis]|uniref:uncharacterized protein LOC108110720 n=1 Tax=Drosophila eugracilis TaxID=29029 RepID=UPI0007E72831|nr:uncharacterized protein LOC108110720 [Drosophila eugracilis]